VTEEQPKTPPVAQTQSLPTQKRSSIKHKKPIIAVSAAIIAIVVLFAPITPTQNTVTKTRTSNLHYTSQVYALYNVPKYVAVTNTDTVGGTFTVRMEWWETSIIRGQSVNNLKDTYTQSLTISAKATKKTSTCLMIGSSSDFGIHSSIPYLLQAHKKTTK